MDDVIIARTLHVLAVIVWIGGVWMVTTVILPAIRRGDLGPNYFLALLAIERRFSWHARAAIILVGLSGFYMTYRLAAWDRFLDPGFWWMHAMVLLWVTFSIVLFFAEPLFLHAWLRKRAGRDQWRAFAIVHRAHFALLTLSCIVVASSLLGAHGIFY